MTTGLGGHGGPDPWGSLLGAAEGDYVRVPVETLRQLQRMGQEQLGEVQRLRAEQERRAAVRHEMGRLDREVSAMESNCVMAVNEAQYRQQESARLDDELHRLRRQLQTMELKRDALVAEVEVLESWLPPQGKV